jgi:hypothetical protein
MKTSKTASTNQPTATKPLYQFDEYTTAEGQRALSVRLDIRDMARLYAEHPQQAGGYEYDWSSCPSSPYIPHAIHNAEQALAAHQSFQFPAAIKLEAARASRDLVGAFEQIARLVVQRDLTAGKLDRRKFAAIARTSVAGTFKVDTVRPYRRTQPKPSITPTIAIVASAGNSEMWLDEAYIPRLLTLTLSILWACEAAGLQTYAALVQQNARIAPSQPYRDAIAGYMLAVPDTTLSPKVYAAALHRDLWRHGIMTAQAADYEGNQVLSSLEGKEAGPESIGHRFPASQGGPAAHWARQVLGADVVIAIGRITDAADIKLKTTFGLDDAVKQIAAQARQL